MSTCPPTATARDATPNSLPSRATVAPTSAARRSNTSAASGCCAASTAIDSGLMIPAFSPAISPIVSPR